MQYAVWEGRTYRPINPQGDTPALSEEGDRLIMYHSASGSMLLIVPKGELQAGYVLGVFFE